VLPLQFITNVAVKESLESVHICQIYPKNKSSSFFLTRSVVAYQLLNAWHELASDL